MASPVVAGKNTSWKKDKIVAFLYDLFTIFFLNMVKERNTILIVQNCITINNKLIFRFLYKYTNALLIVDLKLHPLSST